MQDTSLAVMTFLLNALWQVPVLAVAAFTCDALMHRAPARHRHRIWVIALLLSVGLPIWSVRAGRGVDASPPTMTAGPTASDASDSAIATGSLQVSVGVIPTPVAPIPFHPLILYVSMMGYASFLLYRTTRMWRGWRRAADVRRGAVECEPSALLESIVTRCRAVFRLDRVPVLQSHDITGPLTMSAFSPVIVLPDRVFDITSPDLLASVVGHEMAHVRRRDFGWNILYEALYSLIACHPAAALVKHRIDATREQACDELVTERLVPPSVYARSLVTVAEAIRGTGRLSYALGILDGGQLEQRVRRLVDRRPRLGARVAGIFCTATTVVLFAVASLASTLSLSASQNSPTSAATTERRVIGTWRGDWTEVLVPKFRADMDSSPAWLQFGIQDGRLVGTIWHDSIDLIEQPGSDVKEMRVSPKSISAPMLDVGINGNTVSFKARHHDEILEYRLEILQERRAVLHTKDTQSPGGSQPFRPWLTLSKQ